MGHSCPRSASETRTVRMSSGVVAASSLVRYKHPGLALLEGAELVPLGRTKPSAERDWPARSIECRDPGRNRSRPIFGRVATAGLPIPGLSIGSRNRK